MWSSSKNWKTSYAIKTEPTEKFLENKRSTCISSSQLLKTKNQIVAYRWSFEFSKIRENFVSNPQSNST